MAEDKNLNYEFDEFDVDDDFTVGDDLSGGFVESTKISVVGVGGGGGNAVEYMTLAGISDITYVAANTDVGALKKLDRNKMARVQLGRKTSKGRGAGSDPKRGRACAEENLDDVIEEIEGSAMVFVTAGMGGGTGTGAAPVIAKAIKDKGILTIGVVTKPFHNEREQRMNVAMAGIEEMRKCVDALVIIPNEKIKEISKGFTFHNAYGEVNKVLCRAVMGVSCLVRDQENRRQYQSVDFQDIETALKDAGTAHMALASAQGDKYIENAVDQIINCPLLETSIKGARRMLISVTMSYDMMYDDVELLISKLTENGAPDVQVKFGVTYNDSFAPDQIEVIVIAADFDEPEPTIPYSIDVPDFPSDDPLFKMSADTAKSGDSNDGFGGGFSGGTSFNDMLNIVNKNNQGRF